MKFETWPLDSRRKKNRTEKKREGLNWKIEAGLSILFLFWVAVAYSQSLLKIPVYIQSKEIRVEVVRTPEEISRGLMGRKHLGKDEGMLFLFDAEDYHVFWMKNTLIPLSIAFIDKNKQIIWVEEMEPLTLDSHVPPKPILYALEMNKGWFSSHGIKKGDAIRFSK